MSSDKSLGTVISVDRLHIKLTKILAQGGFGIVFTGMEVSTKQKYAVKRLIKTPHRDHVNEVGFSKQFSNCDNIVGFFGSTRVRLDGCEQVFMVNELCTPLVLSGPLPDPDVMFILNGLLGALSVLHSANPPVIHRDIKVENILISENGKVKLCDFGSATTMTHSLSDYSVQQIQLLEEEIGESTTLLYRAPEMVDLFQLEPLGVGQDVWALGCLVYCLCFYRLPFEAPLAIVRLSYDLPVHTFSEVIRSILVKLPRPSVWEVADMCSQLNIAANHIPTFPKNNNNFLKRAKEHIDSIGDNFIKQFPGRNRNSAPITRVSMNRITPRILALLTDDLDKAALLQCEKTLSDLKSSHDVVFISFPSSNENLSNMTDFVWTRRTGDSINSTLVGLCKIYKRMSASHNARCVIYGRPFDSAVSFFLSAFLIYCRLFDSLEEAERFLTAQNMKVNLRNSERCLLNLLCAIIRDSGTFVGCSEWNLSQVNFTMEPAPRFKLYGKVNVNKKHAFPQKDSMAPFLTCLPVEMMVRGQVKLEIFYLSPKHKICPFFSLTVHTERLNPEAAFHHFTSTHCKFAPNHDCSFDKFGIVLKMSPFDSGLSFVDCRWADFSVSRLFPAVTVTSGNELLEMSRNFKLSKFASKLLHVDGPESPMPPSPSDQGDPITVKEDEAAPKSEELIDFLSPITEIDQKEDMGQTCDKTSEANVLFDFPDQEKPPQAEPPKEDFIIDLDCGFENPLVPLNFPPSAEPKPFDKPSCDSLLDDPFGLPTNPVDAGESTATQQPSFFPGDPFGLNIPTTEPEGRPKADGPKGEDKPAEEGQKSRRTSSVFGDVFAPQPKTMGELRKHAEESQSRAIRKVNNWCAGKGKNIRLLLSSLQDVLWEGIPWNSVSIGQLISADQVKKSYRRAVLVVHPDKVKSSEYEEIATLVYNRLSEAWTIFCDRGRKDMI